MHDILTKLWNETVRDENPKGKGRVYLVTEDGKTANGVVGGNSKADIEEKIVKAIPSGAEIVGIEEYEEGSISHPLRG